MLNRDGHILNTEAESLLEIRDLRTWFPLRNGAFSFHHHWLRAVDCVSFSIRHGETVGLVGESGCGKTTLGRTLLRLETATSGEIIYKGVDLLSLSRKEFFPYRRRLQMIFQDPYSSLNPRMTVRDMVTEGMIYHGLLQGNVEDAATRILNLVGLDRDHLYRYPHEFSGGQRQRINIARALALQPDFLVCDEAVSALDVSVQAQVVNLLLDLREKLELSSLFITHDLSVVRHIAERVLVMYLGRIVEEGPTAAVIEQPRHPYSQALISAAPVVGAPRHQRIVLQGEVPSAANPPPGCRFHPRCPHAMNICREKEPPLFGTAEHRASCYLLDPDHRSSSPPRKSPKKTESTIKSALTLFFILLSLNLARAAVPGAPTLPEKTPVATGEQHETAAETIAKSLADFQSNDPKIRARAVLVLSKYKTPDARQAILQALADPVAAIRLSALVAVTENRLAATARKQVIHLIQDPNVQIRRIASSYLPEALTGGRLIQMGNRRVFIPASRKLSSDTLAILKNAFSDPDEAVRKNMMLALSRLNLQLPVEVLIARLTDTNRDIRILALNTLRRRLPIGKYLEPIRPLIQDPDPEVRRCLAESLAYTRFVEAEKILRQLAKDTDFTVSTTAMLALLQDHQFDYVKELITRLNDPRLARSLGSSIIRSLMLLPDNGKAALEKLLRHPNPEYRYAALQALAAMPIKKADAILPLLNDPSSRLRSLAGRLLMRVPGPQPKILQALRENAHADVRNFALILSRKQTNNEAKPLLEDLMLDDDPGIRLQAVAEICRRKLPDWQEILADTFDGEPPENQKIITQIIIRRAPLEVLLELQKLAGKLGNPDMLNLVTARKKRVEFQNRHQGTGAAMRRSRK